MSVIAARKPYVKLESRKRQLSLPWLPPLLASIGPISLAVLVYAGMMQATSIMGWFPIDLTYFAGGMVALTALFSFIGARMRVSPWVWMFGALWILFALTVLRSPATDYAAEKTQLLFTLTFVLAVAPFALLRTRVQRKVFVIALVALGAAWGVLTVAAPTSVSEVRTLGEVSTIGNARIIGAAAMILLVLGLAGNGRKAPRALAVSGGVLLIVATIATGSRGPLLSIMVGVAAAILFTPALRGRRPLGMMLLLAAGALAYWWVGRQGLNDRSFAWLTGERDNSTSTRVYLWDVAFEGILSNPLGSGWGGFYLDAQVSTDLGYPHNLFLEVLHEAGWFTGIAFLGLVLVSIVLMLRRATMPVEVAMFALAIFALTNAMVSSDINGNRLVWIMLGSAWAMLPRDSQPEPATSPVRS